ncbi:diguanylate cyclase [Chitinivorax sp. B]|uniref:sensor domain-containing diguanylate cyclase n=1 Tax=Chitinivorax sp. B TaxID=2502235 RepID=UPI002017C502|nr:diguanylate cyclase [Chitinivorax sp. B]
MILLASPAAADIVLRNPVQSYPLSRHLGQLPETGSPLSIEQIISTDMSKRFTPVRGENVLASRVVWYRFVINNQSDTSRWLLNLPLTGMVEGYIQRNGQAIERWVNVSPHWLSAANLFRVERNMALTIPANHRTTFYLRAVDTYQDVSTLRLRTYQAGLDQVRYHYLLMGLFFGGLLAIALYNLLIYVSIRDTSYLHFTSYLAGLGVSQLAASGAAATLTGVESDQWERVVVPALLGLAMTGGVNFIRRFLLLDERQPLLDQWARVVWWGAAALAFIAMTGEHAITLPISLVLGLATAALAVVAAVHARFQIPYPARFFLIAWLTLLVAIVLHGVQQTGWLPRSVAVLPVLQIGLALQGILLSFALAHRYKWLSEDYRRSSLEQNTLLEMRVQERTKALDDAMRKLSEANHQLKALNFTDGLTGVRNRKFFDTRVLKEWSRARRGAYNLTLAILDIDHFKRINDTLGHQAGDQVLKEVAAIIQSCLKRPCDFLARYGGEEFVMILPLTEAHGAQQLCEVIRKRIADKQIRYQQQVISVTISIGLCTAVPMETQRYESMLHAADEALYRAKRAGRNRVEVGQMAATTKGGPTTTTRR